MFLDRLLAIVACFVVGLPMIANIFFTSTLSSVHEGLGLEICDNGIDDDDDGLIDLNDEDCTCPIIEINSLIPNPSFETLHCCPVMESQLNCAEDWIQASDPTTDLLHTCGWLGWASYPPPVPFPDGQGIIGFRNSRVVGQAAPSGGESSWKEYAGACLIRPLLADSTYRFELYVGFANNRISPPLNLTFFGTPSCSFLPFGQGDWAFGCPSNSPDWFQLGVTTVSSPTGNSWVKTAVEIRPQRDIFAIAIGSDCSTVVHDTTRYYYLDDFVLAEVDSFNFQIEAINHPCSSDFALSVTAEQQLSYQWYKNGVALVDEISPELSTIYGEGDYQVRIESDSECLLSQTYAYLVPALEQEFSATFCRGGIYQFGPHLLEQAGEYIHTFQSIDQCDSTVRLSLQEVDVVEVNMQAKIFPGEVFSKIDDFEFEQEGSYLATLNSSLGCDSLIYLELEYYSVYTPNVFSPNRDGVNDTFSLYGNSDLEEIVSLTIYNRWGGQVYQGKDLIANGSSGWDGRHLGTLAGQGVYTYNCVLRMEDGAERNLRGSVLLLR